MKVLLVLTNLYKEVGGGQAVYKKIIEATPDVDFFYFTMHETSEFGRPPNAHPVPLLALCDLRPLTPPPYATYRTSALRAADQIARSVAGQSFDVVDVPDFVTFGGMLKSAFAHHQVNVGRVVLSMHGNISTSIDMNWGADGDHALEQRVLEREQFAAADGIYSISLRYMREWQAIVDRKIHYIDPAHFVIVKNQRALPPLSRPSLYCIGRSERRKGNDLFIELLRWLDPKSFDKAAHIGPRDHSSGTDSADRLKHIATLRGISVEYQESLNRSELEVLFAASSIVVLPVRYDSFNLVALEALLSGCPVAVSSKAGVCDYLDEMHPNLPYLKLNIENLYGAVADLQNLVEHYGEQRLKLHASLAKAPLMPKTPFDMGLIYRTILAEPAREISSVTPPILSYGERWSFWPWQKKSRQRDNRIPYLWRRLVAFWSLQKNSSQLANWIPLYLWRHLVAFLASKTRIAMYRDAKVSAARTDAGEIRNRFRQVSLLGEHNKMALREKLQKIYECASNPLYRGNFWLNIARIQRLLGNDVMAVTYELRVLRLLGDDRLNLLPRITETLSKRGFVYEADAARAMYADPMRAEDNVYAYLKQAYHRNLDRQDKPFEVLDDRRAGDSKAAVIVSLYKAADKLGVFLDALSQQSLIKQGRVEIILVDSGSPTAERSVFETYLQTSSLNVVYARSQERETIQAAWNRGIGLARAPYLVFLGVDETLYPEALETLARELDQSPDVDWVMANSLVTAVTESGLYKNDIMPYDRTGATKHHVYLETCYLSWVGGMYRKALHERFGYYDETFSAAGDTEFKNRILPHIKVKFIDSMLGLFLNYPDGQTTASSKAEIEDLRAWYIHRTPGGVRYAFENGGLEEAEQLLCKALGYRKSYCGHLSSDVEYAHYLAAYIRTRNPNSFIASSVESGLVDMLQQLRGLEFIDHLPTRAEGLKALSITWRTAMCYQTEHRNALKAQASPNYAVLNDNRYEQHSWLWKSN